MFVDFFFLSDILVNFRTGVQLHADRPELVILDPAVVARMYATTWLPIDVISGLPMATMGVLVPSLHLSSSVSMSVKFLKLARFLRLVKLAKVNSIALKLDDLYVTLMVRYRGTMLALRMLRLTVYGFFIVHYMACAWWAVGGRYGGHFHKAWPVASGAAQRPILAEYLFSMYWVVTTMTTVGYGDLTAKNDAERAFSIFAMILGGSFYGLLIAKITAIVAEAESKQREYAQRLEEIATYVNSKPFPPEMQTRVLQYYRKFLKKQSLVDETQIIRDLSSGLRAAVVAHLLDTVISQVQTNRTICLHI